MKILITTAVTGALLASSAMAQPYGDSNQRYQQDRATYEQQMRDYENARRQYDVDQRNYDRQYGAGAYTRRYGAFRDDRPNYSGDRNDNRYAAGDPYRNYVNSPCERMYDRDRGNAGAAIGALAGAAIGAGVNDGNDTGAAILGAVVGGVLGNSIAKNTTDQRRVAAKCDAGGYYFSYNQTYPYRETTYSGRDNRYNQGRTWVNRRCRLAVAPAYYNGRDDYRYVRVCPDRQNRYRITS